MNTEKIFICGAVTGFQNNKDVFHALSSKLSSKDFEPVHAYLVFPDFELTGVSHDEFLCECTKAMADCKRIITIKGWEDNNASRTLVDIGRKLNKEVESEITFFS